MADSEQVFPEARERAVRMLQEHIGEYPSFWATIESMAPRIDFVQQSLSECVDTHDVDSGTLDGVTKRHGVSEASISFVRRTPSRVQLRSASDQGGFLFVATIGQKRTFRPAAQAKYQMPRKCRGFAVLQRNFLNAFKRVFLLTLDMQRLRHVDLGLHSSQICICAISPSRKSTIQESGLAEQARQLSLQQQPIPRVCGLMSSNRGGNCSSL